MERDGQRVRHGQRRRRPRRKERVAVVGRFDHQRVDEFARVTADAAALGQRRGGVNADDVAAIT